MENEWENYLLSLEDSIFFDILRNYLGEIKTPFDKHDLIRKLNNFISKKEIKQRILALIDDDDSRLLTAIVLLDKPKIEQINILTKDFYSFLELHNRVENLQQRLLICIEDDANKKILKFSPIFAEEIKANYIETKLLFPSLLFQTSQKAPWLKQNILSAFLSFLSTHYPFSNLPSSSNNRKKLENSFSNYFNLSTEKPISEILNFLKKLSEMLGIIVLDKDYIKRIDWITLKNFSDLQQEKSEMIFKTTALAVHMGLNKITNSFFVLSSNFFRVFPEITKISIKDFFNLFNLLQINAEIEINNLFTSENFIAALVFCGFAEKNEDYLTLYTDTPQKSDSLITVQPNFEVSIPANTPLSVEVSIACCCELLKYDIVNNYELTKKSFTNALDLNSTAEIIINNLETAAKKNISQNIIFTIEAWAKEYSSISLTHGILLTVDKTRNALIEHCKELKKYIISTPSPGVYLLSSDDEESWRNVLKNIGFDIIPSTIFTNTNLINNQSYIDIEVTPAPELFFTKTIKNNPEKINADIISEIDNKNLSSDMRKQFEAMANKKILLEVSSINRNFRPNEKREAGGIDHRAKIRLVESAIDSNNLLEINIINDLDIEKKLIKPLKLIKEEASSPNRPIIFTVEGLELPIENKLLIPITRISYIKMLKNSLYSP